MLNLTKLDAVEIPLNKLTLWEDNVRTSGAEQDLDELIASICSVGLLQSLVVKKASRGTFVIGAGKRRFLALSHLADKGDVKRSYAVPCRIAPDDADLTEISLAENICRLEMSPQQEVIAWRRLVEEGKSIGDISIRFGVSEIIVHRRLALARLSPALWTAYEAAQTTSKSCRPSPSPPIMRPKNVSGTSCASGIAIYPPSSAASSSKKKFPPPTNASASSASTATK